MKMTQAVVTMVILTGTTSGMAVALDVPALVAQVRAVAGSASCRSVNLGILAHYAEHGTRPTRMEQVSPYVRGDVTTYRIVNGAAAGPGCPTPAPTPGF